MICSRNDIVLLPIPFTDLTSRKVRPAVVVGMTDRDLFLVPISSQLSNTDLKLRDWGDGGLNVACGFKAQIATVEQGLVLKVVGHLSNADSAALEAQLRTWLSL
jgi:mRNA interferase MazF